MLGLRIRLRGRMFQRTIRPSPPLLQFLNNLILWSLYLIDGGYLFIQYILSIVEEKIIETGHKNEQNDEKYH